MSVEYRRELAELVAVAGWAAVPADRLTVVGASGEVVVGVDGDTLAIARPDHPRPGHITFEYVGRPHGRTRRAAAAAELAGPQRPPALADLYPPVVDPQAVTRAVDGAVRQWKAKPAIQAAQANLIRQLGLPDPADVAALVRDIVDGFVLPPEL